MKKGLVNLGQGTPEQLRKLKIFIENMKAVYPARNLKTLALGIEFAVEQAGKVPALEKRVQELKERITELEKQIVEDREMRG